MGGLEMIRGSVSDELASQRTAMAFERTAMASDRTLMSVVQTSLALIGFGFTIFQFFHKLTDQLAADGLPAEAPRRFGLTLITLGVVVLSFGIASHRHQSIERRRRRTALFDAHLMHEPEAARPNSAMIVAVLLLVTGLVAVLRVALRVGPF